MTQTVTDQRRVPRARTSGLDPTSKSWFNILGCKDTSIDPHPSPTTVVAGSTRSASKIQTILPSYSVNQYCRRTPIQSHSFLVGGYRALFHMKRIPKDSLLIDFNSSYDPNNILRIDRSLYPLPSKGAVVSTKRKLGTTNRQHGTKKSIHTRTIKLPATLDILGSLFHPHNS